MYEVPSASSDAINGVAGTVADGATAGVSTSGAANGSTGGTGAHAGTSGSNSPNSGGTAGAPASEPTTGGEGGAPAVADECPIDADKLAPGACGCGVPEAPSVTLADCDTLKSLLAHRYDFEGGGTSVKDRIGSAHGAIARGATLSKLDGKGVVLLGGGDVGAYVDLPNGLLSSLTNATIETWVTWGGGDSWQRIFDFGDSTAAMPENNQADGNTYLFLTPRSGSNVVSLGFSLTGVAQEFHVPGSAPLAQTLSQVVAVADDTGNKLLLYVNGVKLSERAWTESLAKINDVNSWLGRSQYQNDNELNAVFHEFRIYDVALTAPQVTAAFNAGPDPQFLAY